MVKPGDNRAPAQQSNGVAVAGPSASGSIPPEAGDDFSFIVIDRSMQDNPSGVWNPSNLPSLNGAGPSVNNALSMQHSSIATSFPHDLSPEEVQRKLQDLLQENIELKETLQQNNLAMKQQFATLVTWQEDVVSVQQHHKEKFEETKVLIAKLKAENANLTQALKKQPDVSKLQAENEELRNKVDTLQQKLAYQDQVDEENGLLKTQLTSLEQRLNSCMTASEAQVRAERRVCELTEEKQQLMRINDELTQTVALMQAELANIQVDSFVVVETEERTGIHRPVPLPRTELMPTAEKKPGAASSPDGVTIFCRALDKFDEKLMISYQRLDQQMESFSHLFGWLQRVCNNLPSYNDAESLKAMLIDTTQKIHETQGIIHGHRVKLDESRQQLGRLGSEFQELLQEWVQFSKQHKDIEQNNHSYQEVQTQGFKEQIDRLTAQLLDAQEKLASNDKSNAQQPSLASQPNSMSVKTQKMIEKIENLNTELTSTKEKLADSESRVARQEAVLAKQEALVASNKSSEEVQKLREEIDRLTAELLSTQDQLATSEAKASQAQILKEDNLNAQLKSCQDKLTQCETKLSQHAHWLADRDAALAQLNVKLSQQDAKIAQRDTELQQADRKIKGLEQNIDGLSAQAEVYKMDFNEERESRQKLAADKERVVDDLRALQRRNQTLLEQLEEKDRQLAQAQQSVPVSSNARSSYNTIATPGRVRNQWPPDTSERHQEPEPIPQYECPKCQMRFRSLQPLQNHVEVCIDLDMFP